MKDAKCDRTNGSYPSLIAKLHSVTGARATTRDFWNSRSGIPPRIDALTPDTGLVTLTLGGNDVGFSDMLADIRRRSPHAKVIVVGYPALFPDDGVACPEVPFSKGDFACLRDTTTKADRALERQAVTAGPGTSFADTYTPTIGHDMCRPRDERWIESLPPAQNTTAAHPNTLGRSVMAASALWQIYQPCHRP
ncbi:SGNH/GDSL hydrolase family protein [Streptomyces sp. 3213.3]|uniref:SGNH/GDSL hydrolase family protein n=1 Tax=Streptomyces sp. 3213.3 TaxID=1855348 RepID=UPI000A8583D2|nr:SGNH/GDSL hydrolase family protein [Streptomyces sp. 3213.3]